MVGDEEVIYNGRKLAISGIAGILVASLIIASTVTAPWVSKTPTSTSPTTPPGWSPPPLPPITTSIAVSNFTEPQGLGSEANLTVTITSEANISNVVISVSISKADALWSSKGIAFDIFGDDIFWVMNLTAGLPVAFSVKVKAMEIGYGKIEATAKWSDSLEYQPSRDLLGIVVFEDEILMFEDYYGALPPVFPPGFNPTPPNPSNITGSLPYP